MLLLGTIEAYSESLLSDTMQIAMAIESIHTYSLIHDDLPSMDDSPLRRGVDASHIKYDEVTALLVGDALNTYAFELIATSGFDDDIKVGLVAALARASGASGMVLGQAIDCYYENQKLSQSEIEFLHIHKTGKLIAVSLSMAGVILRDAILTKNLYDLGISLGLLFQIQDDILDVTEDSKILGKPTNNDQNKNSFVNILGLEQAKQRANELKEQIASKIDKIGNERFAKNIKLLINKYL